MITEQRIASGIEVATIIVERQLQRKRSTVMPVNTAAVNVTYAISRMESLTKPDASFSSAILTPGGSVRSMAGNAFLTPASKHCRS